MEVYPFFLKSFFLNYILDNENGNFYFFVLQLVGRKLVLYFLLWQCQTIWLLALTFSCWR